MITVILEDPIGIGYLDIFNLFCRIPGTLTVDVPGTEHVTEEIAVEAT